MGRKVAVMGRGTPLKRPKKKDEVDESLISELRSKYPGLSDSEIAFFESTTPKISVVSEESDEEPPKQDEVPDDKEEKESARLKKEVSRLKKDNASLDSRLNKKIEECAEIGKERDELKKVNRDLKERIKGLEDRIDELSSASEESGAERSADIEKQLQDVIASLEREGASLRAETSRLGAALADLTEERDRLLEENERLLQERPSPTSDGRVVKEDAGTVVRTAADILESDLFTYPKYRVIMSHDGSRMTFEPNVQGKVVCSGNKMRIPSLPGLLPFSGRKEYRAALGSGATFVIDLLES